MCFYVLKVVRCPGYDHRHDEESRNGRDIKIDILEAYIWISESFRVKSRFYRSTGGLLDPPPRGVIGPTWALREKRKGGKRWPRAPPLPSPNRTRRGGRRPPFLSLFLLFPTSPSPTRKEGSPTPGGSRTPPWRALLGRPPPPLGSFIYGGKGAPLDTQVDLCDRSLAVCGAPLHHIPPRSYRCGA